jgi:hypothetical protein
MMIVVGAIAGLGACAVAPPALIMDREIYAAAVAALSRNDEPILTVIRKETLAIPRIGKRMAFGGVDSLGLEPQSYERVPIVHKQRVSRQFGRECNRVALAGSEPTTQVLTPLNWSLYLQPFGCGRQPVPHEVWSPLLIELRDDRGRHHHAPVERRQDMGVVNQIR